MQCCQLPMLIRQFIQLWLSMSIGTLRDRMNTQFLMMRQTSSSTPIALEAEMVSCCSKYHVTNRHQSMHVTYRQMSQTQDHTNKIGIHRTDSTRQLLCNTRPTSRQFSVDKQLIEIEISSSSSSSSSLYHHYYAYSRVTKQIQHSMPSAMLHIITYMHSVHLLHCAGCLKCPSHHSSHQ